MPAGTWIQAGTWLTALRDTSYAEREEANKGTLMPGKRADLAVLSQDVFTVPVDALPRTESVLTMIGGRIEYDAGALPPAVDKSR